MVIIIKTFSINSSESGDLLLMQSTKEEILGVIADNSGLEILFGPSQKINDLVLLPVLELVVCGTGFNDQLQGGGVFLRPKSIFVIKENGEVSTVALEEETSSQEQTFSSAEIEEKIEELTNIYF